MMKGSGVMEWGRMLRWQRRLECKICLMPRSAFSTRSAVCRDERCELLLAHSL